MSKRKVFRLRWSKRKKRWCLHTKKDGKPHVQYAGQTKKIAMDWIPDYVRSFRPSQLFVHNKSGRIAFERTYGGDPERHKG